MSQIFSLSDEIQKFQKQILALPQNISTLDQRFYGGGIRMQDLIQQNNFIITQMRRIKNVFVNYCLLNDKIYRKIIQHQVNANQRENKMVSLAVGIERKIEGKDLEVKDFRREIMEKAREVENRAENFMRNTQLQLEKKVDIENLTEKIRNIIQKYQQFQTTETSATSLENTSELSNKQASMMQTGLGFRKKRGEDMEQIRQQMGPIQQKINELNVQIAGCTQAISDLNGAMEGRYSSVQESIVMIKEENNKIKIVLQNQNKRLVQMVNQAMSQPFWKKRFDEFNIRYVIPQIEGITMKFMKNIDFMKKNVQQSLQPKFNQINKQIIQIKNKQQNISIQYNTIEKQLLQLPTKIYQIKQQILKVIIELDKKYRQLYQYLQNTYKNSQIKLQKDIQKIKKDIKQIIITIEQLVLKKCQQKIYKDMKQIRNDFIEINKKINQQNISLKMNIEQVQYIKDVVATKANYTDLVLYFDSKADKQSFRQLQQLINQTPQTTVTNISAIQSQTKKKKDKNSKSQEKWHQIGTYTRKINQFRHTQLKDIKAGGQPRGKQLALEWGESTQITPKQYIIGNLKYGSVTLNLRRSKQKIMRPTTSHTLFLL